MALLGVSFRLSTVASCLILDWDDNNGISTDLQRLINLKRASDADAVQLLKAQKLTFSASS